MTLLQVLDAAADDERMAAAAAEIRFLEEQRDALRSDVRRLFTEVDRCHAALARLGYGSIAAESLLPPRNR